ncbi:MAG: hypothetical protein AAF485_23275, partial [Chloroflexota bacterium]
LILGWWRGWLGLAASQFVSDEAEQSPNVRFTSFWLSIFAFLFLLLLIPADTRDVRYFLPAVPSLYGLGALGLSLLAVHFGWKVFYRVAIGALLIQLTLTILYAPYFTSYWNPAVGGPWLAPRLVKIGSGEGIDQVGRYLSQKPNAANLTVATSFWESFAPFFPGNYTKAHYDQTADYLLVYRRQIQNRNPFPEYWQFLSAREPEYKVSLMGLEYAWLYPGPQLRLANNADFGSGLQLQAYRFPQWAAQPGEMSELTLVWSADVQSHRDQTVLVQLVDQTGTIWVENHSQLLDPNGPSSIEGRVAVDIPVTMPRGDYQLWVTVAPTLEEAEVGFSRWVGDVAIRYLEKPIASLEQDIDFGEFITFGGANLDTTSVSRDQALDLTYVWQARQPIPSPYTTFTHVVDEAGGIWGQVDRITGDGRWPTTDWDTDEWIVDQFQLSLNPETPAGNYKILIGVYHSETFERLPIISEGEWETVIEVGEIVIQ